MVKCNCSWFLMTNLFAFWSITSNGSIQKVYLNGSLDSLSKKFVRFNRNYVLTITTITIIPISSGIGRPFGPINWLNRRLTKSLKFPIFLIYASLTEAIKIWIIVVIMAIIPLMFPARFRWRRSLSGPWMSLLYH